MNLESTTVPLNQWSFPPYPICCVYHGFMGHRSILFYSLNESLLTVSYVSNIVIVTLQTSKACLVQPFIMYF